MYGYNTLSERDYFNRRDPGYVYISKRFGEGMRFVHKIFVHEEDYENVTHRSKLFVVGEESIRSSPQGRSQLRLLIVEDSREVVEVVFQKFVDDKVQPLCFKFSIEELGDIFELIEGVAGYDFASKAKERVAMEEFSRQKILVSADDKELLDALKEVSRDRRGFLEIIRSENLTKEDLDILSGRKQALEDFEGRMVNPHEYSESDWQQFLQLNSWIFGYGLDYRYLNILQREAHVASGIVGGKSGAISDYLMGTTDFTVLVEVKKPDTGLFENREHRSGAWTLSKELVQSVSQILEQKATWQILSQAQQYDSQGNPIRQRTIDPRSILVIGHNRQFMGDSREAQIKEKTFELYRRNSRNIDIVTYSELLDRARFIVRHQSVE